MSMPESRAATLELDEYDPLAALRDRFALPEGVVYLDGNSLGPPLASTLTRLQKTLQDEWGNELVRAWNSCD